MVNQLHLRRPFVDNLHEEQDPQDPQLGHAVEDGIFAQGSQVQELQDQHDEVEDVEVVSPQVGVLAPEEAINEDASDRFQQEEDEGRDANGLEDCRLCLVGLQLGGEVGHGATD